MFSVQEYGIPVYWMFILRTELEALLIWITLLIILCTCYQMNWGMMSAGRYGDELVDHDSISDIDMGESSIISNNLFTDSD